MSPVKQVGLKAKKVILDLFTQRQHHNSRFLACHLLKSISIHKHGYIQEVWVQKSAPPKAL
jgi:hypothetical protein